jgi:hypothetical protein
VQNPLTTLPEAVDAALSVHAGGAASIAGGLPLPYYVTDGGLSMGPRTRGRPEPAMSVARSVAEVLREHVLLEVEAIDRMYLNVYVPHLQSVEPWSATCGFIGASDLPRRRRLWARYDCYQLRCRSGIIFSRGSGQSFRGFLSKQS